MAVFAERDVFILSFEMRFAVRADREVGIVAVVVAFGILQPMLLAIGIEMRSRGLEVRSIALRVLMKVDGMYAGGQILEIEFHSDSWAGFRQNRGTHSLALGILKVNHSLGRTGGCECD